MLTNAKPDRIVQVADVIIYSATGAYEVLMIDEALKKVRACNPRQARPVQWRFFGGLSVAETGA